MIKLITEDSYNGFDSSEFNTGQMDEIRKDPEAGIDVSRYADSKFDYSQIITEEDSMKLFMKSCIDDTIDEFIRNPNKTVFTNFDAIFDTRDFTADEEKVYKTIQTKNAKKTGRKLF